MSALNYTDISHLIRKAHDAFDSSTWGRPEAEPRPAPKETDAYIELHEVVEHEPDAEVQEYVQQTAAAVPISEDLQNMGVQSTHVVQYPHYKEIQVPLSDEKIAMGLKKPINEAIRWLAEICRYLLRKAHIRLKIAHGKAKRVFEK